MVAVPGENVRSDLRLGFSEVCLRFRTPGRRFHSPAVSQARGEWIGADAWGQAQDYAVNIEAAESDLAPMDTGELVAAATGRAQQAATAVNAPSELAPEDAEKRQNTWWYLLLAGLALLVAELVVANRLSEKERFT